MILLKTDRSDRPSRGLNRFIPTREGAKSGSLALCFVIYYISVMFYVLFSNLKIFVSLLA